MVVATITAAGQLLYADLSQVGETQAYMLEQPSTPLGADYATLTEAPTPTPGIPYVGMTADNQKFVEVLGSRVLVMESPWNNFVQIAAPTMTRFFKDAYVARFETGFLDFGDAALKKNYLEILVTWQRHSRAYLGLFAETEDGRRDGRFLGLVFNTESQRIPLNLCGRRIRVRGVIVAFNGAKALITDMAIGWNPAGRA